MFKAVNQYNLYSDRIKYYNKLKNEYKMTKYKTKRDNLSITQFGGGGHKGITQC